MAGIKEGTRSGLYYEGYKILKAKRPTYSIIENVKNLTSKRFEPQFKSILKDLEDLGYTNYWKVLNSKDYGIPQNRERVFIISIHNDYAKSDFCFPKPIPLIWKLKDFLENEVDEKYYLTEKGIGIRQAYAEDTELQQSPILTIITEEPVKGDLINEFLKIDGVTRVSIY